MFNALCYSIITHSCTNYSLQKLAVIPVSIERGGVFSRCSSGLALRLRALRLAGVRMGGTVASVVRGVVVVVGGVGCCGVLLSPFCSWLSFSRCSFAPFFAFLNRMEVRRPTPPETGRVGDSVFETPLSSFPSLGDSTGGVSRTLEFWVATSTSESASGLSVLGFRGSGGDMVLGSVIGRRVGGSSGVSPGGGDKARPEGSRVGGGVDLQSSRNEMRR